MKRMHCNPLAFHAAKNIFIFALCTIISVGCVAGTPSVTPSPTSTVTSTLLPTVQAQAPSLDDPGQPLAEIVADKIGVDLGGIGERALEFVDVAKTLRRWENVGADVCTEGDDACRCAGNGRN